MENETADERKARIKKEEEDAQHAQISDMFGGDDQEGVFSSHALQSFA